MDFNDEHCSKLFGVYVVRELLDFNIGDTLNLLICSVLFSLGGGPREIADVWFSQ